MSKDLKTQMRDAIDGVLDRLADEDRISKGVRLRGVRLDQMQYHVDLEHIPPMLLIPRDEGDKLLMERDDAALSRLLLRHVHIGERMG